MSDFTWQEMSDIVHVIKEERVVVCGAIQRLKLVDNKLHRIEKRLLEIISDKDQI